MAPAPLETIKHQQRGRIAHKAMGKTALPSRLSVCSPSRSDRTESASGSEDGGDNNRDREAIILGGGRGQRSLLPEEDEEHEESHTHLVCMNQQQLALLEPFYGDSYSEDDDSEGDVMGSSTDEARKRIGTDEETTASTSSTADRCYRSPNGAMSEQNWTVREEEEEEVEEQEPPSNGYSNNNNNNSSSSNVPSSSSEMMTDWELAKNIEVDAITGTVRFIEPSAQCDACPDCFDVCDMAECPECTAKHDVLKRIFGDACLPEVTSSSSLSAECCHNSNSYYAHKNVFTLCEVKRHRRTGSAWIVYTGVVYDVTDYLENHPGGKISILRKAGGADCSEDFSFHTKSAQKLWKAMMIGSIVECPGKKKHGSGGGGGDSSSSNISVAKTNGSKGSVACTCAAETATATAAVMNQERIAKLLALAAMAEAMQPTDARCSGYLQNTKRGSEDSNFHGFNNRCQGSRGGSVALGLAAPPPSASQCVIS